MTRVTLSALWAAIWTLVVAFWTLPAAADDLALAPRQGVLLLHNGQLISGLITAAGDRYDVNLDDGEMHIPRSSVALLARDAQECYVHKRAGIDAGRVQDHIELAEWCLRNALLEAAEKEIAAAKAADATHPKIRLVATRLQLAKENPKTLEPIETPIKARPDEQLDNMVRGLPAGSVETFTNNIQPMLLNRCTGSGCHGPQSEVAMRLERIPPNRRAGRKPTQRNLQAALAMVDRTKPEESKLLQVPLRPHGPAKSPIFGDREQSQYQFLVQWVYQVAGAKPPQTPASVEDRATTLSQVGPREVPASATEEGTERGVGSLLEFEQQADAAASGGQSADSELVPRNDSGTPIQKFPPTDQNFGTKTTAPPDQFRVARVRGQAVLRPVPKRGEKSDEFVPKDPFDPAIFNRRFFGE